MAGTAAPSDKQPSWGEMLVRVTDTLTWQRPLYSLAVFICCNFLFWFLAFTLWRIYHILSLISIGLVMVQITRHFLLSRSRGAQVWRGIVRRNINYKVHCRTANFTCIFLAKYPQATPYTSSANKHSTFWAFLC